MHDASTPQVPQARTRAPIRGPLPLLGPAFVTAIAYVDPGNFATNVSAGSTFGYLLVWVVVVSNVMAMLIQYLSAKAGIATGQSLPALCRSHFSKPLVWCLWVQAEIVAIATDLAEVVGGAIALKLLFDMPLALGGLITAVIAFALLGFQSRGHRPYELAIVGLLAVILVGLCYNAFAGGVQPESILSGTLPRFDGQESLLLATGMLGATVMPHAIYVHGALTQDRYVITTEEDRGALLRSQRLDVAVAMTLAGVMNLALLVIAAKVFSGDPRSIDTIEAAHGAIGDKVGAVAALLFALALLASGFAASSVGTFAGQVIMGGFLQRRIALPVRRLVTLAPALVLLAADVDPTRALVISQVVLSFGIPIALIPLVLFTSRRSVMGSLVNRRITTAAASLVATVIIALNAVLIGLTVFGS